MPPRKKKANTRNTQEHTAGGNTKTPAVRSRSWCFTINNPTDTPDTLNTLLSGVAQNCRLVFQLEKGENGTEHYQGLVTYKNAVTFATMKQAHGSAHWERTLYDDKALLYVTKEDTRIKGPWLYGDIVLPQRQKKMRLLAQEQFKAWQIELIDILKGEADLRTIHWYWEPTGNAGKTAIAKYICASTEFRDKNPLVVAGKAADVLNAVCTSVKKGRDPQIVIWDVPRSVEDHISWQAIESVKNGFFYSGKYEGGQCMFDNPHVVIFANIPPPKGHLSEDRIVQHAIEGAVPDIDSDVEDEAIAALADLYGRGGGTGQ